MHPLNSVMNQKRDANCTDRDVTLAPVQRWPNQINSQMGPWDSSLSDWPSKKFDPVAARLDNSPVVSIPLAALAPPLKNPVPGRHRQGLCRPIRAWQTSLQ